MSRDIWVETGYPGSYSEKKNLQESSPSVYSIFEGQSFNCYYGYLDNPEIIGQVVKIGYDASTWPNEALAKSAVTIFEVVFRDREEANQNRTSGFIWAFDQWLQVIGSDQSFVVGSNPPVQGISFSSVDLAMEFLNKKDAGQKLIQAGLKILPEQAMKLVQALAGY